MSVERWRAVGTIVVGVWCVVVASLKLANPIAYSAGDYRGDPTFLLLSNGALILVGIAVALYGIRTFLRSPD